MTTMWQSHLVKMALLILHSQPYSTILDVNTILLVHLWVMYFAQQLHIIAVNFSLNGGHIHSKL